VAPGAAAHASKKPLDRCGNLVEIGVKKEGSGGGRTN
jgi:hypothetical protein